MAGEVAIRLLRDAEVPLLAENFRRMWLDIGWQADQLRANAVQLVEEFVDRARQGDEFAGYVAEIGSTAVGSAACQAFAGLYPEIRQSSEHRSGYIWGVFVEPSHRRQGIATKLTRACVEHLESRGFTRVVLHASPDGDPVYRAMGFEATNELALRLR